MSELESVFKIGVAVNDERSAMAAAVPDEHLFDGLDPIVKARAQDMLEMNPDLRTAFAMAWWGRILGWSDGK